MNRHLLFIIVLAAFAAAVFVSGFVLDKLMKKAAKKKYRHEFSLCCYAVAKDICNQTHCDYKSLRRNIEHYLDYCTKYLDLECAPGFREYYSAKDYLHFTYLAALDYVSQYRKDDFEREEVTEFCSFKMPDFSNYMFFESYEPGDDLNMSPKNSGYLIAFALWLVLSGVVIPIIRGW